MRDVLRGGRDSRFCLDRFTKGSQRHVGENLEGEQAVLLPSLGVEYIEGDAPVVEVSIAEDDVNAYGQLTNIVACLLVCYCCCCWRRKSVAGFDQAGMRRKTSRSFGEVAGRERSR